MYEMTRSKVRYNPPVNSYIVKHFITIFIVQTPIIHLKCSDFQG